MCAPRSGSVSATCSGPAVQSSKVAASGTGTSSTRSKIGSASRRSKAMPAVPATPKASTQVYATSPSPSAASGTTQTSDSRTRARDGSSGCLASSAAVNRLIGIPLSPSALM
jgi:hypothetical protein